MSRIEGEAKRVIGFGVGEFYTFVNRTPVGQVSIQIPRVMVAGAPETLKSIIQWEGDGKEDMMDD